MRGLTVVWCFLSDFSVFQFVPFFFCGLCLFPPQTRLPPEKCDFCDKITSFLVPCFVLVLFFCCFCCFCFVDPVVVISIIIVLLLLLLSLLYLLLSCFVFHSRCSSLFFSFLVVVVVVVSIAVVFSSVVPVIVIFVVVMFCFSFSL